MLSQTQKNELVQKTKDFIDLANRIYNRNLTYPTVKFDLTGMVAGTANSTTNVIQYNDPMAAANYDDFINRTVPHEVAHIVDNHVFQPNANRGMAYNAITGRIRRSKRSVHGPTWKRVMADFGIADSTRCHSYDVTKVRKNWHKYQCPCGYIMSVGPKHHNAIQRGNPRGIYHAKCPAKGKKNITLMPEHLIRNQSAQQNVAADAPRPSHSLSKIDRAVVIVNGMKESARELVINEIRNQLNMSPSGAQTYYYLAKKKGGM